VKTLTQQDKKMSGRIDNGSVEGSTTSK